LSNKINQRAPGLLNLLESQSLGTMPSELALEVRPTIELGKYYENLKLKYQRLSPEANTFGADGILGAMTVPPGFAWFVRAVALSFRTDGAGNRSDGAVWALNFRNTGTAVECAIAGFEFNAAAAAIATPGQLRTFWLPEPLLLLGGESMRWYAINTTVVVPGDFLYRPAAWYTELSV